VHVDELLQDCIPGAVEHPADGVRERLGLLLVNAGQSMMVGAEEGLVRLGIGGRGYVTLAVLARDRPRSQLELAQLTGKAPALVVGIVDELEAKGWAVRDRDPDDRRRSIVRITDAGREVLARADEFAAEVERASLPNLDAEERAQLLDLLQRAIAPARAADPA
jgi:DNA-binding MarR family transcriptional regulator